MSDLSSNNTIKNSMQNIGGKELNSSKNKKNLLKCFKDYVFDMKKLWSVIFIGCLYQCIKLGKITLVAENEDNKYYRVQSNGMILAMVDNKAKLFNYDCTSELKKHKFTYDMGKGNFITTYEGKTTSMEKIVASLYLNVNIDEIRDDELHHKTLRCINCVEALALLSSVEHNIGHKLVGRYARNQCIYIDTVEDFDNFISILEEHLKDLSTKDFGLEF